MKILVLLLLKVIVDTQWSFSKTRRKIPYITMYNFDKTKLNGLAKFKGGNLESMVRFNEVKIGLHNRPTLRVLLDLT